jgi:formylglycine-generating enzyme required for sulfatase activity
MLCYGLLAALTTVADACIVGAQPTESEGLFYARWQYDEVDFTAEEIERTDDYSLLRLDGGMDSQDLSATGGSMILTRFAYELAKERGFKYFIVADPGGNSDSIKVYLVNDTNIPLKDLVGDDYSEDLQEVYDDIGYVPVSMFGAVFDNAEPLKRNRLPKDDTDMAAAETPTGEPTPPGRKPGEVREFAGLEFVWIPPGTFEMGAVLSPEEFQRRYPYRETYPEFPNWWEDEMPRHAVTISRGFWLGRYEVTNQQFRRFDPDHESGPYRGLDVDGADQPVVNISWRDAQRYLKWLASFGAGTFRLPTEAEWEYACRAGTTSVVYWGDVDETTGEYANVADETLRNHRSDWVTLPTSDGYLATSPVGTFKPNDWGLYDMIGNVWEHCNDWWGPYSEEAQTDPKGPRSGDFRIFRGGSAWSYPYAFHAAARQYDVPRDSGGLRGFRVVRVQE